MITNDIRKAKEHLDKDDIIAIPTETVNGLADNIFSDKALEKILTLKRRPSYNPLIVHQNNTSILSNEIISMRGDLTEAAANLFSAMHRLDKMHLDILIAEIVPSNQLGKAINHRLQRAVNQNEKKN